MKQKDIDKIIPVVAIGVGVYILFQVFKPVAKGAGETGAAAANLVNSASTGVAGELQNASDLVQGAFSPYSSVYNWVTGEFNQ